MNFFKLTRKKFNFINYYQKRELKRANGSKDEVLIANFSAIFAALACLKAHGGVSAHPRLIVVSPSFWMDKVDPYYHNAKFGQKMSSFPSIVQELIKELYPNHAPEDTLSWEEVLHAREYALKQFEQLGVPVFRGSPVCKRLEGGQFEINIMANKPISLIKPKDTHFYFWYRQHKRISIGGIQQPDATELYHKSPLDLPLDQHIFVLGSGLAVIWLARHFATKNDFRYIFCLKRKADHLNIHLPSNQDIDYSRIKVIDVETSNLHFSSIEPGVVEWYCPEDKVFYRGRFFTAIGLEIPYYLIEDVPKEQVTAPSHLGKCEWIAQKNLPKGSAPDSILSFYKATDNLFFGRDFRYYHEYEPNDVDNLSNYMKTFLPKTLDLDDRYFIALKETILSQDDPVSDELLLLVNVYEKTYSPSVEKKNLFLKEVTALLNQRDAARTPGMPFISQARVN